MLFICECVLGLHSRVVIPLTETFQLSFAPLQCFVDFCHPAGKWGVCPDDVHKENQRGPLTVGPARRVAEQDFIIVVGE